MQALSAACEDFLISRAKAVETARDRLDISSVIEWTSLAEECNMTQLLANCELILARTWDTCLWQDALRAAQHHMIASEQRMQQMVVNRYNSFHTGARQTCHAELADLIAWQNPTATETPDSCCNLKLVPANSNPFTQIES